MCENFFFFKVEEKSQSAEETRSNGTSEASEEHSLANTKEKTPMCLINELARYNKVMAEYVESGKVHVHADLSLILILSVDTVFFSPLHDVQPSRKVGFC